MSRVMSEADRYEHGVGPAPRQVRVLPVGFGMTGGWIDMAAPVAQWLPAKPSEWVDAIRPDDPVPYPL